MNSVSSVNRQNDNEKLLLLSLSVASGMLRNGGETYRAEDCAKRILSAGNATDIEVFAIPTSILITVVFGTETLTRSVSVKERDINLTNLDKINTISRSVSEGGMTPDAAIAAMDSLERTAPNPYLLGFCSAVSSSAFSVLFGGSFLDMAISFLAALITNASIKFFKKTTGYGFLTALSGSVMTAVFARLAVLFFAGANLQAVIIGGIMPMLPGLSLTNAVRDTINGDIVSGSSKATEAALQAIAIAAGVGIVLAF